MRQVLSKLCPGLPEALAARSDNPIRMLLALVKETSSQPRRWEVLLADELTALKQSSNDGSVLLGAAIDDLILHSFRAAWSDAIITSARNLRSEPDLVHRPPPRYSPLLAEWRQELGRQRGPLLFVITREDRSEAELQTLRDHRACTQGLPTFLLPGGRLPASSMDTIADRGDAGEALAAALHTVESATEADLGAAPATGNGGCESTNILVECGPSSTSALIAGASTPPFSFILLTVVSGLDNSQQHRNSPLAPVQPSDMKGYTCVCESEAIPGHMRVGAEEDVAALLQKERWKHFSAEAAPERGCDEELSFRLLLLESVCEREDYS